MLGNLLKLTRIGREILCRNRQGVRLHSAKNIEKKSNRNENQRQIRQGNVLSRCQIKQFLLYLHLHLHVHMVNSNNFCQL